MKKIKKLSFIAGIVLMMGMFLVSCGGSSGLGSDVVGTWTMTGAEYSGYTLTQEDLQTAMNDMPVFTINEDGSAVFAFNGSEGAGNVAKNDDGTYTLSDDSEKTLDFAIEDGKLVLDYTDMNMKMIFEKTEE